MPATLLDEDPAPEAQAPAPSRLSQTFDHPAWTSAADDVWMIGACD